MEKTIIKSFNLNGNEITIKTAKGYSIVETIPNELLANLKDFEINDMARMWLKDNGYEFEQSDNKITLKRAKIILKPKFKTAFVIRLKDSDEYIYQIEKDGTFMSSSTMKPLKFAKEDIDLIGNLDGFVVEEIKLTKKAREVVNKLA